MVRSDRNFFNRLVAQQSPQHLWIGCSDSRVPANEIVGLLPGEMFVHRNVGNLVVHSDLNCLAVLQFAVDVLRVRNIIVCGHYGCGGVRAALEPKRHGLIDNWLRHIQDVELQHTDELKRVIDPAKRADRVCELSVIEQVRNVARTTILQEAWARGQSVAIHAWVYALSDGIIRDLGVTLHRTPSSGQEAVRR